MGIFRTFNNIFGSFIRKRNASIVGPSKQISGEFPEITMARYYEYYHGWDQIKRSVDTQHQKFIGNGIKISSNNEEFNDFINRWWNIVNAQKKLSDFFMSVFITGNGILEIQFDEKEQLSNVENIPMTTIYRIYRDEYANELKITQQVDGIFKDLDPKFYIHWTINNPDKQAFGKSEFHTLAAPRKVSSKIDPSTGEPINPDRNAISLLDAQARLQNAEVEIKEILARPKIFATFPNMPQDQMRKLEGEMSDPANNKYIWFFDKKPEVEEAGIRGDAKYSEYGMNVENHIDIGTGFASKVITNPAGFSYSSSQTPLDVLDQRMATLQADASEMLKDKLIRRIAETWGYEDFDEMEVKVSFMPSPRKFTLQELPLLPPDAVSPEEIRFILKELHVPLNDEMWESFRNEQQKALDDQMKHEKEQNKTKSDADSKKPTLVVKADKDEPESEKSRPKPKKTSKESQDIILEALESLRSEIKSVKERIEQSPAKYDSADLFIPDTGLGDHREQHTEPKVTDPSVLDQFRKDDLTGNTLDKESPEEREETKKIKKTKEIKEKMDLALSLVESGMWDENKASEFVGSTPEVIKKAIEKRKKTSEVDKEQIELLKKLKDKADSI